MGKIKTGVAMGIGAGIAAAAIGAAVGSYFLTGSRKAKTKRVLRGWMLKAKGEILEKLESFCSSLSVGSLAILFLPYVCKIARPNAFNCR